MLRFGVLFAGLVLGVSTQAGQLFHARDFGAIPDGRTESGPALRSAIKAASASGAGSEVLLEAGTYLVAPERPRTDCLPINGADGLLVRGRGVETRIVFGDPISSGFSVRNSRNVVLREFVIDYDPLPFCQGTIRGVNVEAGHFEIEIDDGYPSPDGEQFVRAIEPYGKWGMIMDRATRRIKAGTPDHYMAPRWELIGGRSWRFFAANDHFRRQLKQMQVGDAYVHLGRGHGTAILAQGCDGLLVEKVEIRASPGLAVGLIGNSGALVVRGLEVRFAPGTDRLLTTNADGVHCQQNRTGPVIEQSYFEGMADDGVNIYAPPIVVREVLSPSKLLVSASGRVWPGDRLQVFDPRTGQVRGTVQAADVTSQGRLFMLSLKEPFHGIAPGEDHRSADTLYNLDACGAGFQIRQNEFRGHRRYGCLLRAGGGTVEDNLFEDTTGAGVVLTNEPDWPEGPVPWETVIRRNRFVRGGMCAGYADSPQGAALIVRAARLGHALAESEPIRGISIVDNTFVDRAGTAVFIGGANGVTLSGNHISGSAQAELRRKGGAIVVDRSSSISIADTEICDERPGVTAAIEIGQRTAPGQAGVRTSNLKAKLAPGAQTILDLRPN
jgi:hypothetical protein